MAAAWSQTQSSRKAAVAPQPTAAVMRWLISNAPPDPCAAIACAGARPALGGAPRTGERA